MSYVIRALLALTRHGGSRQGATALCSACLPEDIRHELASLSHAADIEALSARDRGVSGG